MNRMLKRMLAATTTASMIFTAIPAISLAEGETVPNVTFEARAGETVLQEIAYEPQSYTYYDYMTGETVTVDVHIVEIPQDCEAVDLSFSENVLAYNYNSDGEYLDGWYENYMVGADTASVQVDSDGDGNLDYIQVQTPYDEDWNSTLLYTIRFAYEGAEEEVPDFSYELSTSEGTLSPSATEEDAYSYLPYGAAEALLCPLDTYTVPAGTEEVTITFNQNVLVYNYDGNGNYLAGWVEDYMTGSATITVKVDSDGNGTPDYLQIQTPYDANWNSDLIRAITFEYEEEETEEETTEAETTEAETTEEETEESEENATTAPDESGSAAEGTDKELLNDIYVSTANYLNKKLSNNPIAGMEWYVIALSRAGYPVEEAVIFAYYDNLKENLEDNDGELSSYATTNARTIMALTAAGFDPEDVSGYNLLEAIADYDAISSQGLNGIMYALIALDCGEYEVPETDAENPVTRDKLVEAILAAQLKDNGWAYSGSEGDPDMTCIALEALAPYYASDENVKDAVDKAVEFLSSIQNEDGTYTSWGTANSDSTAQVIIALSTLGIDADTDARFVKNGNSVLSALLGYYLPESNGTASAMSFRMTAFDDTSESGGFGYDNNDAINDYSTIESFDALTSYGRMTSGENTIYDMTDAKSEEEEEETTEEATEEETEESEEETTEETAEETEESNAEESTEVADEETTANSGSDDQSETTAASDSDTAKNPSKVDSGDSFQALYVWLLLMAVSSGTAFFVFKSKKRTK